MGDIKETEFKDFISIRNEIMERISKLIGYGSGLSDISVRDFTKRKWNTDDDYLFICEEDDDDGVCAYKISSYAAKGEKFFMGESDGLFYIMAYDEEDFAEDAELFVFSKELKNENVSW